MIRRGLFTDADRCYIKNMPDFDAVKFVKSMRPNDLLQKAGTYSDIIIMIETLDIPSETKKVVEDALTDKIRQLLEQFKLEENAVENTPLFDPSFLYDYD